MCGGRSAGWSTLRAAIAVAVLYALALQSVFGAALAADFAGPVHRLCFQAAGGADDGSGSPSSPHTHLPCCTAVHLPHPASAPPAPQTVVVWPARRIVDLVWRAEVVAIPRGPPRALPHARGPPTA